MRGGGERGARLLTMIVLLLLLGPPCAVALTGVGTPLWLAVVLPFILAVALHASGRIPAMPLALARRHPVAATLWLLVLCAAAVQVTRASVFAYDVTRREWSAAPGDDFRSQHACFTAYYEAARLAAEGGVDVYDSELYRPDGTPRRIGPLTVDPYHYPPPFLLIPVAVRAVAPEFAAARRLWFGLQALVLAAVMLGVARWVGGDVGRRLALASATLWALPTTWMALQSGNFQVTALPIALAGAALAWSASPWLGTGLLTYAAGAKVFPAMLVLHLVVARRWRALRRVTIAGLTLVALTVLVLGTDPFVQFLRDELPRVASGASFPQTERPAGIQVNQSIYGFTARLRALGIVALDQPTGKRVAQVYALMVAVLACVSAFRSRAGATVVHGPTRLALAARWLAILNLASFASPFVGNLYGGVGTTWVVAMLAVGSLTPQRRVAWLAALVLAFLVPWVLPTPISLVSPRPVWLVAMIVWQVGAIGVNVWAAWPRQSIVPSVASTDAPLREPAVSPVPA